MRKLYRLFFFSFLLIAITAHPFHEVWFGFVWSNMAWASDGVADKTDLTTLTLDDLTKIEIGKVYSASKFDQKTTEAPASVSIITSEDIKQYGYRTLADIINGVRGFYTSNDRNYQYVGTRGFSRPGDYNTRILLLVDGHKINDNIYGSASIGTDFVLDVDLIDRVEVIRGPGSSLYGTNAIFGIFNVITKKGQSLKGFEVSGEAGSYDTYKGRVSYGNKFQNGFEMLLSSTAYNSHGQSLYFKEFNSPKQNYGYADSGDYDSYQSVFANISYHGLSLNGAFIDRKKGIPTAPWGIAFNETANKTDDQRGYIELKYAGSFAGQLDVMTRLYYDKSKSSGTYVVPPLNKDFSLGEWWGGELQLNKTLFGKHKLTVGAEYQDNFRQDQSNYDVNPFSQKFDDRRTSNIWAVYAQDQFSILKNLLLNVGVRYDYYTTFGGTTNPRAALIYSPFEKSAIKLIYGEAFRAPNMYELYYNDGSVSQKSNPNLKPEKIATYELAYEQYFKDQWRISTSGYYYNITDLIAQQTDADGLDVFKNVNKAEALGAEFEIEKKWDSGIGSRLSYSYQRTQDKDTNLVLTNSPRHIAKWNTTIPIITPKLSAGIELLYLNKRKTLQNDNVNEYLNVNVTLLSKNLIKGLEISGSVYNLFGKKYSDPGAGEHWPPLDSIEQDGCIFRLKITYRF